MSPPDTAIQQRAAAYVRSVRGAENPTAIPQGVKLRKFFRQADRQLLSDTGRDQLKAALQFSQGDWELLTAAAQRDRSVMDAIEQASQVRMQNACQRISAGNLEPAAIGRSLSEAEDQNEQALTEYYTAFVDRLSPDGQRALLSYVDNTVSRSMTYGRIDFESVFAEFPELSAQIVSSCASSAETAIQEAIPPNSRFAPRSEFR
jgi:hypothetical protein